jgi:hypothetical protein
MIDFSTKILGLDGEPLKQDSKPDAKDADLAFVATSALCGTLLGDEKLDGFKKYEMGKLAHKIGDGKKHELLPEELTMIRERIGKAFPALWVFRAHELLK